MSKKVDDAKAEYVRIYRIAERAEERLMEAKGCVEAARESSVKWETEKRDAWKAVRLAIEEEIKEEDASL